MFSRFRQRSFYLGVLPLLAALRLVPRRYRWRALIAFEGLSRPVARALVPGAGFYPDLIAEQDRRLYRLLERATRVGLRFDPHIEHDGIEHLEEALARESGCLCVGIHAELLYLAERYLYDIGRKPAVISMNLGISILGTGEPSDFLARNSYVLLQVRRAIADGKPACAMIDYDDEGKHIVPVRVGGRELPVKTSLLSLALSMEAPILFFHATRSGDGVRILWEAPTAAATGEEVAVEFGDFLRRALNVQIGDA